MRQTRPLHYACAQIHGPGLADLESGDCVFPATHKSGWRIFCGRIATDFYADDPVTDTRLFEEIDRRMKEIFARSPAADLEKNLRVLLQSAFSRLDLVSREEFDVQREVLARTRAKLAELEAKLAELEKK